MAGTQSDTPKSKRKQTRKQTRIEKLGLAPRVEELMTGGLLTAARIADTLREENPDLTISTSTVQRYVARLKDSIKDNARTILADHVAANLPKDLDILEEMQAICLDFMREAGTEQAERVAESAKALAGEIPFWQEKLAASENPDKTASEFIKRAIFLLAMDDRKQEARLKAMNQLNKTIDTKFKHGGLLESDGDDGIRIHLFDPDKMKDSKSDEDGYQPFSVIDGRNDGA